MCMYIFIWVGITKVPKESLQSPGGTDLKAHCFFSLSLKILNVCIFYKRLQSCNKDEHSEMHFKTVKGKSDVGQTSRLFFYKEKID